MSVPMRFVDFSLRAWREGKYLQVIAHATPAGGMRQPVPVKLGEFNADDFRLEHDAALASGAKLGRRLSRLLLPDPVWRLLGESLRTIAPRSELGLRLRLCLDDDLIDLPWEYLYRPDVSAPAARGGFLLMDGRISLVREPPSDLTLCASSDRVLRGLFVGALFDDGSDVWSVKLEHQSLARSMRSAQELLTLDFVSADDEANLLATIASGCDVFHYAGHTEVVDGRGTLVQLARSQKPLYCEALAERASWAWIDNLAMRLRRAGTRLAVFNACDSGFWPFVRPLMRAGIPAVVGVQGEVSNLAALNFADKLYGSLAVGLTLDEALTFARLHVVEPERSYWDCDWGRFMAYMPTESAIIFPRTERDTIGEMQRQTRDAREQTVRETRALTERLDGAGVSRMLTDIADRTVLILGRFTDERKEILEAIKRALTTPPHGYVPILFDFTRPDHRDLIESIVRFAAVSRFVIADLSDPKSVPAELQAIVPQFPSLPVVPIIEGSQREYPVSDHILRRNCVARPVVPYQDLGHLLAILDESVIAPAEKLYEKLNPPPLRTYG